MKNLILFLLLAFSASALAQVAVNSDGSEADNSAMLDVKSTSKGLLIPRMTLDQRNAIASPAQGLLVYQTDNAAGFYYNSGTGNNPVWTLIGTGSWAVAGNAGTNPSNNFLGTTDNVALKFRVFNTDAGFIDPVNDNTSLGKQSLNAVTTGTYNSAFGTMSLGNTQAGIFNTAIGYASALQNNSGSGNVSIGANAQYNNTSGENNVAIGMKALFSNTTGRSNVAIGQRALYSNYDRNCTVAVGDSVLYFNGTNMSQLYHATANSAVGSKALFANTNGFNNTAFGYQALMNNSTGYQNTASGAKAMFSNINGVANAAFGAESLYYNTIGQCNTAAGFHALHSNTGGNYNTAIGDSCLFNNSGGYYNTAAGVKALFSNTNGIGNIAVGYHCLYSNVAGNWNTAVGKNALDYTNSDNNTSIGYAAGSTYTFTQGTFLGANAYPTANNFTNCMALGYNARVDASNKVVIGNTSVASIGGYEAWTNFSDGRFKKNVTENVPGLAFINELKPVTYTLDIRSLNADLDKNDPTVPREVASERYLLPDNAGIEAKEKIVYSGFIAQEVETAARKISYNFSGVDAPRDANGHYGLRYGDFVVPLVKAVQELDRENEALERTIEMLKERVSKLEIIDK
jgi:trimeric autotransporter adhesin